MPGLLPKWRQDYPKARWLRISVGTAGGVCGHVPAAQSVLRGSMPSGAGISAHGFRPPLVPAATWLMSHDSVQRLAAPFISWISRYATMRCSLCVTVCPYFSCRRTGEG
ncbi:MAG: hypothetical protein M0Q91_08370 [Methanoregula sp.]|nr:hypothetical protein [Methanoregula sp.]